MLSAKLQVLEDRLSSLENVLDERDSRIESLTARLEDIGGWDAVIQYNNQLKDKQALKFAQSIILQPYGVLGQRLMESGIVEDFVGPAPQDCQSICIVDPAGLKHIQPPGGPKGAGGAAGAIYRWLGIHNNSSFTPDVISNVTRTGDAKHHKYRSQKYNKDIHVIHAVGPDLRMKSEMTGQDIARDEATLFLYQAYHNVFKEFLSSKQCMLRLLPISGGIFSAHFMDEMHELTFESIQGGYLLLSEKDQKSLHKLSVHLCIFAEEEMDDFSSVGFAQPPPPLPTSPPVLHPPRPPIPTMPPPPPPRNKPPTNPPPHPPASAQSLRSAPVRRPPNYPPPPPPASSSDELVGKHVVVCGLVNKADMNGVRGFVTDYDKTSNRYAVRVHVKGKDVIAKLKFENVELVAQQGKEEEAEVEEKVEEEGENVEEEGEGEGAMKAEEQAVPLTSHGRAQVDVQEIIKIPNSKVGLVIGKGGSTLAAVKQRTGVSIKIAQKCDDDDSSLRSVTLIGERAAEAAEEVMSIVKTEDWEMVESFQAPAQSEVDARSSAVGAEDDDEDDDNEETGGSSKKKKKKKGRRGGKNKKKGGSLLQKTESSRSMDGDEEDNADRSEDISQPPGSGDDETLRKELKPSVNDAEAREVMLELWPWVGRHCELGSLNSYDDVNFLVKAYDVSTDRVGDVPSNRIHGNGIEEQLMDDEAKESMLKKADELKARANALYGKNKYTDAIEGYTDALKLYESIPISSIQSHHAVDTVKTYSNRALCYTKLQMFLKCKCDCSAALEINPSNTKALYRRVTASRELEEWANVRADAMLLLAKRTSPAFIMSSTELSFLGSALEEANERAPPVISKFTLKIHNGVESSSPDLLDMQDQMLIHLNKSVSAPLPQPTCLKRPKLDLDSDVVVMGDDLSIQTLGRFEGLVSLPVRGKDGQAATFPLAVRLLSWVEGELMADLLPADMDRELMFNAGSYLGRIDTTLTDFQHPSSFRIHAWDLKNTLGIREFIHCLNESDKSLVAEVLDRFEGDVLPLASQLPTSVIMGDFNDANIIVGRRGSRYEVQGMIDVGDMVHTWRVCEVAIAAAYSLLTSYGEAHYQESAEAILAGYTEVLSLTKLELSVFKTLVACRLACSFTMGMFSYSKDPSNKYLLKHAAPAGLMLDKWWRQPEG